MYALIDANAFYASCETVFNPKLRTQPVVVLTNNDACVCAVNRLAKELGVPKFSPYFKIKELCERNNVVVKSSNYELYADLSHKMMNVIGKFSNDQYIYSIDECFLYFKQFEKIIDDFHVYGSKIRRAVFRETRLPVCVGFGSTPTLAKAANHIAKKYKKYRGVAVIDTEEARVDILSKMDINDVWGIGRKTSERLRLLNIRSGLELANCPPAIIRKDFNIEIERTVRELNNEKCIHWDEIRSPKKQIYSTRSFGKRIHKIEDLHQALSGHIVTAARSL